MRHLLTITVLLTTLALTACVSTTKSSLFSTKKESASKRVETYTQIGIRYIDSGEVELAMQNFKKALELDAKDPKVHEALGMAFQITGEYDRAAYHFKQSLAFDPSYTRARNNYAVFLYERGEYQAACQQLEVVVQDVYYLKRSDAFANLAVCAKKFNNIAQARTYYQRAIKLNPRHAQSYLELAELDFKVNDFVSAQSQLKAFHSIIPKGVPRSLLLGYRIANIFNQTEEAQTYKFALMKLYPQSTEAGQLK